VCHSSLLRHQDGCGCGKFGAKRPQVQILSPRPVPRPRSFRDDLWECHALRAASHLPAIATDASREQEGTRGNPREGRGPLRRPEEHPSSPHDVADPAAEDARVERPIECVQMTEARPWASVWDPARERRKPSLRRVGTASARARTPFRYRSVGNYRNGGELPDYADLRLSYACIGLRAMA